MKTITETRGYKKLVRVRDFAVAHRDYFSPGSLGARMISVVTWAATPLASLAVSIGTKGSHDASPHAIPDVTASATSVSDDWTNPC